MIYAEERGTPKNRKKIDWKLITDLPVGSRADAIEKLEWYALSWKIEVYHKILQSGRKAEESKLRTAQRLTNLISLFLYPELAGLLDDDAQLRIPTKSPRRTDMKSPVDSETMSPTFPI
ncbi:MULTISPECIES: hypothetical protein [unclassified Bradyrhizobium]|uniref:hypothetical protein n=1 Tax=unclassified Bradyrhizobium TaxID=2631580 RepID=UPI001FFA6C71|nr:MULTISPECIES: hypothetical protein [unclassified Bradyrhizobium]